MASDALREMSEFMRLNPSFGIDMSIEEQRAGMEAGVGALELPSDM